MLKEVATFFGGILIFAALIVIAIFVIANYTQRNECDRFHALTGIETSYAWSTPCLVKVDNRWIKLDTYTTNVGDLTVHQK